MKDIKRIIIPVDNSENSKKAVKQGAFFAKLLGVNANIITINDTHQFISSVILEEKLKNEASAFLENFKKIAEEYGVNIETDLIVGKPSEEIVKYAQDDDLIIIAHHEKTKGFDKAMDKSISRDVVNNAPCSVLIVK
ncbi:MAG: universal stress protein [Thermoplasmatales archaeon]|nr:MAG: universal stress protein [Thermoplasmatales archaeon]